MEQKIGKVIEVFVPGNDAMNSTKIGFKIEIENEVIEVIEEQNEINANIYKNDLVLITKQVISGKEFIDIELLDEVNYE